MIDTDFLRQLNRFSLILQKRITSNYTGERKSTMIGQGLIFKDHAQYALGDDFRKIDWRVFARTDKFYVKRYEEERNLTIHIIVDFSASMNFGKPTSKSDYASMLGIGFAYMATKDNERFVLSTFSEKLDLFSPKKGAKQLAGIVAYLNERKPIGATKFEESLARYKNKIGSKSLIIIISDFLYDLSEIKNSLARLKGHEIVLIQVLDKTERELSLEGEYKLQDLETKEVVKTFISSSLRKSYLRQLNDHQTKIKKICDQMNAKFFIASTDKPIFDTFFEVLMSRYFQR
ncbi:DUF58 domain-containing protein [Candidatus Woesearchaeota archaeon]|nr:DUF58 domain-containing protein [Candidatus Woesearchaeota archaeon]